MGKVSLSLSLTVMVQELLMAKFQKDIFYHIIYPFGGGWKLMPIDLHCLLFSLSNLGRFFSWYLEDLCLFFFFKEKHFLFSDGVIILLITLFKSIFIYLTEFLYARLKWLDAQEKEAVRALPGLFFISFLSISRCHS